MEDHDFLASTLGRLMTILGILALGAMSFSGCEGNFETFYIDYIKAPAASPACTYTTTGDTKEYFFENTVDVFLAGYSGEFYTYQRVFALKNMLAPMAQPANGVVESNSVIIKGAYVHIDRKGYKERFSYLVNPMIEPQNDGLGTADLLVWSEIEPYFNSCMPDSSGWPVVKLLDTIDVIVRFTGRTQGGVNVETPDYKVKIKLCCGCLIKSNVKCIGSNFPMDIPACCSIAPEGDLPCAIGSDLPIDCTQLVGCQGAGVCPTE